MLCSLSILLKMKNEKILSNKNINNFSYREFKKTIKEQLGLYVYISAFDNRHKFPHLHIDKGDASAVLNLITMEFIELPNKEKYKFIYIKKILEKSPVLTKNLISYFCQKNPQLGYCKKYKNNRI